MNRKHISLISLVAMVAIIGGVITIDNVTAKEGAYQKINYTVEMEDIFKMKAGETRDLPLNIVNLGDTKTSVNIYVTEEGKESFKSDRDLAFSKSISVSISKSAMNLDASSLSEGVKTATSLDEAVKSPMFVTVSIPNDTEPGLYAYSLIVQKANDSHSYIKYFYVNVE